jgi:ATP-dependent DNA helicase RecQ
MKLKIMGYNEEMVLTVSGELREVMVHKEDGCLILELLEERPAITAAEEKEEEIILPTVPKFNEESAKEVEDDAVVAYARDNTLFHRLSDLRRKLAVAEKVAPYLIFHDKTLWGMVEKMPEDLPSLGKISGVGKAKLEKYGSVFLEAIKGVAV